MKLHNVLIFAAVLAFGCAAPAYSQPVPNGDAQARADAKANGMDFMFFQREQLPGILGEHGPVCLHREVSQHLPETGRGRNRKVIPRQTFLVVIHDDVPTGIV